MIESAAMWATSLYSWFTPGSAVLFLLLNLVIATIALSAKPSAAASTTALLSRSPSIVLERLKSFTFSSPDPQTLNLEPEPDREHNHHHHHHIDRSQSDTKPTAGEMSEKLPKKMKKSATVKSAFEHFQEDEIATPKRPATARERVQVEKEEEVEEVDARADDFINRFRHQLKLQRINSIIRYREMIKRGAN